MSVVVNPIARLLLLNDAVLGGDSIPSNALLWDDGSPVLWDDGSFVLWE